MVVVVGVTHQSQTELFGIENLPPSHLLGAELLIVLEGVGLRAWVLTIAERCYDCEECCSQSFDF